MPGPMVQVLVSVRVSVRRLLLALGPLTLLRLPGRHTYAPGAHFLRRLPLLALGGDVQDRGSPQ
eukprot:721986-Prorocentrum_lima.AAC.1